MSATKKPRNVAAKKPIDRSTGRFAWSWVLAEVVFSMTDQPEAGVAIVKIQFPEKTDFVTYPSHRIQRLLNVACLKVMEGFPADRQSAFKAHDAFLLNIVPLGRMTDAEFWAGHPDHVLESTPPTAVAVGETPPADNVVPIKVPDPAND